MVLLAFVGGAGCGTASDATEEKSTSTMGTDVESKLDASLRHALRSTNEADTTLQILLELDAPLDDQRRRQLEEVPLRNLTAVDSIATASGTPLAIRKAAELPFVRSIALSRERPPLE